MPEQGSVISQPPDSAEDLHEGQGAGQPAAEFGLDGASVDQHRVPDTVIAVGGELIEDLVGCSAEQALPNQTERAAATWESTVASSSNCGRMS